MLSERNEGAYPPDEGHLFKTANDDNGTGLP